ncbi:MAG TPA: helix-turn-helix domain-containing protein, partial [Thermoanaerobaculales bacterium]|nr:helix-turn-helix domain-containing protein [Thermoanaerobaculales bacterium]
MSAPRPLIFRVMDAVAGDASLTGRDRLVLLYVVKYADRDGAGCIVSNDTLARALCVDPATVTRAIARLVKRGLIQRKRRRWTSAVTTVAVPQESAPAPVMDTQESAPAQPRKRTSATKKAHQCARTGLSTDLPTVCSSSEADAVP